MWASILMRLTAGVNNKTASLVALERSVVQWGKERTVPKLLFQLQVKKCDRKPLQFPKSMTFDTSVLKVITRHSFVEPIDPFRQHAFLNGYLGCLDLKDRWADNTDADLHPHENSTAENPFKVQFQIKDNNIFSCIISNSLPGMVHLFQWCTSERYSSSTARSLLPARGFPPYLHKPTETRTFPSAEAYMHFCSGSCSNCSPTHWDKSYHLYNLLVEGHLVIFDPRVGDVVWHAAETNLKIHTKMKTFN